MKRIYSIVLMATALLIGTNAWAKTIKVAQAAGEGIDYTNLATAFANAESGDVIQLQTQMSHSSYIWIGDAALAEASGNLKELTLDLNGQMLTYSGSKPLFQLTHGKLTIKTSQEGGKIQTSATPESVVLVTGSTLKDCKPKTQTNYYSHLVIENGVEIIANKNAVVIDGTPATSVQGTLTYTTNVYKASNKPSVAHGVRVDIYGKLNAYKYGLKVNGLVTKPTNDNGTLKTLNTTNDLASKVPAGYTIEATDVDYIPYIFIANGAELQANATNSEAVGLYCAGYADYLIQGNVHGSTGVYVKSGNVEVADGATIKSDNNDATGIATTGQHAGVDAGGNAISVESNSSYAGGVNITISGGTITAGENGQSVQNENATGSAAVEAVVISGGTFTGGASGAITLDPASEPTNVQLTGGTFAGNIETLIAAVDNEDQIIQQVVADDGAGNATVVIGKKDAGDSEEVEQPAADNDAYSLANGDIIKLDTKNGGHIHGTLNASEVTVKYLSLTGTASDDVLITIEEGKTLNVGQIVMNAYGKIVVKAGGKLIVSGANGIFADAIENIVLETSIANPSIFLLNPAVANNKNPKAKVEFMVKSFNTGTKYIYQRFGLPTMKDGLELVYGDGNPRTRFWSFDYSSDAWVALGYINPNPGQADLDYSKLNDPFEYYQMYNFAGTSTPVKYTFEGRLLGNSEPTMAVLGNSWKGFANSYMGEMSLSELLKLIPSTVDKAIYTYNVNATIATWEPVTNLNSSDQKLNPMQPFLIRNRNAAADVELDYEHAVYNPTLGIPNPSSAPSRALNNITKAKITIANEYSQDYVVVAEDAEFSAEFDNGYDATKFMNDGINMYVSADEKMSIFATDNLNNTYVGFQSVEGGNYTMEFANVQGEELTLIDHETGARVAMVEGNTYEFNAAANSVNDYRFEIVASAKVPTAIENAAAAKSAKGIYTITGQYLGEMSVWNSLPAGVYVIDGAKRVK